MPLDSSPPSRPAVARRALVVLAGVLGHSRSSWLPALLALAAVSGAQVLDAETAKEQVTLGTCLRMAVENNFGLRASEYQARASGTQLATARAAFDPVLRSNGNYTDAKSPTSSSLEGTAGLGDVASSVFIGNLGPGYQNSPLTNVKQTVPERKRMGWDISLAKKFSSGMEATASYSFERLKTNQFFATINPSYSNWMQLAVTQPILRGGWFAANLSGVRQGENQIEIAREEIRAATSDLVFLVQQTYWELVYSLEDLEVRRESLRLAELLRRDNLEKFRAGTMTKLDVTQADFDVATRKNEVRRAVTVVQNGMDRLRQLVDPVGFGSQRSVEWFPVDRPLQKVTASPAMKWALATAFQSRSDWRQVLLDYENAKIREDEIRNGLLPKLDLTYSMRYSGVGPNTRDPFDDMVNLDFDTWSLGFSFELPIGNRAARASYLRTVMDRRRQQATVEDLRSQIHVEIRESVREINTTLDTVTQTREALRFAREQLKGEQARLDVGKSTSYRVLDIQEDLARAQIDERRALLDHMIAHARLQQSQGTILEYFGMIAPKVSAAEMERVTRNDLR